MTRNVIVVSPTTSGGQVAALFRRYGFRAIPVVDDDRKVGGTIREKGIFVSEE